MTAKTAREIVDLVMESTPTDAVALLGQTLDTLVLEKLELAKVGVAKGIFEACAEPIDELSKGKLQSYLVGSVEDEGKKGWDKLYGHPVSSRAKDPKEFKAAKAHIQKRRAGAGLAVTKILGKGTDGHPKPKVLATEGQGNRPHPGRGPSATTDAIYGKGRTEFPAEDQVHVSTNNHGKPTGDYHTIKNGQWTRHDSMDAAKAHLNSQK